MTLNPSSLKQFFLMTKSRQKMPSLALIAALFLTSVLGTPGLAATTTSAMFNDEGVAKSENKTEKTEKDAARKGSPDNKTDSKADTKTNTAEMAKVVEALEERIRLLEEKLARLNIAPAATPANVPVQATLMASGSVKTNDAGNGGSAAEIRKEIATLQDDAKKEEAKKNEGVLKFFRDTEVSGIVDGYYSYNNNKVDMHTQGRVFDVRHNAFSLQLAKITLSKANSKEDPLGFRIDLGFGETVDRTISVSDSSRNDGTKHILQAYASYVAPIGKGLTIDFGKFYTPIGAEVIETKDNYNYSRSFLFAYGPFYHTGFRAKYAFNDKVALTGFLVNGWDNAFENNVSTDAGKTFGFQLGLTPTKKFSFTETFLTGPEAPLANVPAVSARDNWRHVADTVASYAVNDKFTLLGNFVVGSDADNTGDRGTWVGFAGYFKYAFNSHAAFSPRFEVFNDKDGLRSGVAQTIKDITLTQELKVVNNLITRFEYRRDFSNQNFFTNSAGRAKDNQNTFTIGISYFFTNRD
ncbi:MAG: porin [Acidobacteriota bacterium]